MRPRSRQTLCLLLLGASLSATPQARAQTGGPYELAWHTLAGGGMLSGPGGYQLEGTIAQSEAGQLAGGDYTLTGGFLNLSDASVVDVDDGRTDLPVAFRVLQNVPNPFSAQTTVAFELPTEGRVEMAVFNLRGERVRRLLDQVMPAGRHHLVWAGIGDDGRPLPSGVYWIKTRAGDRSDIHRTVLLK